MIQYQQAYANYISALKSQTTTTKTNTTTTTAKFSVLPNSAYSGKTKIQLTGNTIDECQASCSTNSKCKGATFFAPSGMSEAACVGYSDKGDVTGGYHDGIYAIVPELAQNAQVLQMLNKKLIDLNHQMSEILNSTTESANQDISAKNIKKGQLASIYDTLMTERQNIDKLVIDSTFLDQKYEDNSIYVTQSNTLYIMWTIITIIIIMTTIKMQFF